MNVLISGASVAGPALAWWLNRHGITATVVERAAAPRPGGQAIDLRGAARDVVTKMDLMDAVRAAHTGVRGMANVDSAGRTLFEFPADLLGDSGGVIAEIEILRGDLVNLFYEATRDDVEYVFGDSITSLTERADGIVATFENGPQRTFDLVVGADGVHSNVRALAFGPEDEFVRDLGYHHSIFSMPAPPELGDWQLMYNLPRGNGVLGRLAGIYPTPGPARGYLTFAGAPLPKRPRKVAAQKQIVADAFAGAGWLVPEMLRGMHESEDFYFDRACKVDIGSWSRGRAVLLGDSAFAGSVGMGTSMAIVGAYVLAGELAAAHGDHRAAIAGYENVMRDYVRENQKPIPGGLKGFLPSTPLGLKVRGISTRIMLGGPWRKLVTGGMQEKSEAIVLRDYAAANV